MGITGLAPSGSVKTLQPHRRVDRDPWDVAEMAGGAMHESAGVCIGILYSIGFQGSPPPHTLFLEPILALLCKKRHNLPINH